MKLSRLLQYSISFLFLSAIGCNFFGGIDKPSGDIQLLSAARACFDEGDYVCASNYYNQISSSYSDEVNSELAFQILAQNGMGVETFANAVISFPGNAGKLITQLASSLVGNANETVRLNIFHAFQKAELIKNSPEKGLVAFITGLSLLAELLAESAVTQANELVGADLYSNVSACTTNFEIPPFTGCQGPIFAPATLPIIIKGTSIDITTATDTTMSGSPTLYMINSTIQQIDDGVTLMAASGNLGSSTAGFTSTILAASSAALADVTPPSSVNDSSAYRALLFDAGIGGVNP